MNFSNQTIIITGGATGIGAATAEFLAQRDAKIYVLDIQPLSNTHEHIKLIHCDVSKKSDIKQAVEKIISVEKNIHGLFANAGIHFSGNVEQTSEADLDNVININLKGIFYTLQAVLPIMREQQYGNIVLMGSDQTLIAQTNNSVYGLTKGAIGQLTKSTAIDYAPYHIRVNCVCPGIIDTPLYRDAIKRYAQKNNKNPQEVHQALILAQPIQRAGQPHEVAQLVGFLLSQCAAYMTGALISIDGGTTCV